MYLTIKCFKTLLLTKRFKLLLYINYAAIINLALLTFLAYSLKYFIFLLALF